MDTGAAAFSPPIFRPALPSFTWQTPRATFGVLIVRQRRSLLSSVRGHLAIVSSRSEYALPSSSSSSSAPEHTRIRSFSCSISLRDDSLALLAFMTGTHLLAVRRLHKGTLLFCLAYQGGGGSNARGDRGLATGIRIFDPFFFLSLCLCHSTFCLFASIDRKENAAKLDCLRWEKI